MSNISLIDKLKYFIEYQLSTFRNWHPYKRVVINADLATYKKMTKIMNSIHQTAIIADTFQPTRVVILYTGDRVLTTVLVVTSYMEIEHIVNDIVANKTVFPKKIFADFPIVIDYIHLLTYENKEIDVTNTLLTCIEYKDIKIKFSDISIIHKKHIFEIDKIKIKYFNQLTLKEDITLNNFEQLKDYNIDLIHKLTT